MAHDGKKIKSVEPAMVFGTWKTETIASLLTKFPAREKATSWCTSEQNFLDAAPFSILVQRFHLLFDLILSNYGDEV